MERPTLKIYAWILLLALSMRSIAEGLSAKRFMPQSAWVQPLGRPSRALPRLVKVRHQQPIYSTPARSPCRYSPCGENLSPIVATSTRSLLGRRGGGPPSSSAALTVLSRAVGYVIIAGSMLYKVPQVARIFKKKSAEGISCSMFTLETVGTTMSLLFSVRNAFPFSTYGEAFFILLQNIAILIGISVFDKNPPPAILALGLALGGGACAVVLSPAVPLACVSVLQTLSIPLLNFSRVPQIIMNHQRKSTGELAPTTLIMQAAGNLARIFTTLVQVKNNLFLASTLVAMAFNGILCYQYFLYRSPSATAADKAA